MYTVQYMSIGLHSACQATNLFKLFLPHVPKNYNYLNILYNSFKTPATNTQTLLHFVAGFRGF